MNRERLLWKKYATAYDETVFHLTKYARIRKRILASMQLGLTLDFGCGPRGLLLADMNRRGDVAIGLDISPEMLNKTQESFRNLRKHTPLVCADGKLLPFKNNTFDSVVSVNSILPEKRSDADQMFMETYRVLKPGGRLVTYLISYDYGTKAIDAGIELKQDPTDFREWDTDGWQCCYTEEIIETLMRKVGYSEWTVEVDVFDKKEELEDAKRIYQFDFYQIPIEEYFLVATK